jgi:hypothetical protein
MLPPIMKPLFKSIKKKKCTTRCEKKKRMSTYKKVVKAFRVLRKGVLNYKEFMETVEALGFLDLHPF